jgi:hypothetical protein
VVLVDGSGGGGGGGGGPNGFGGTANSQFAGGGGGAASRRVLSLFALFGATSLDIVIGAGGSGGAGGGSPGQGGNGGHTTVVYHDGSFVGQTMAKMLGAEGGGFGGPLAATSSNVPVFTPGGRGAWPLFRSLGLPTQLAPGFRQLQGIYNTSGTLSAPGGAWPVYVYTDPVGQMEYYEGGASVANAGNATYAAALSYAGAQSPDGGGQGGAAAIAGVADGIYPGGAGGGGGGGSGGNGGAGGHGGNANASGNGTTAAAGGAAATNGGGGGGGGGSGGNASGTGGAGAAGGAGGSGFVNLLFLGLPTFP